MVAMINEFKTRLASWNARSQCGQDLTEYALLVALIALVVVLAVIFFGESLSEFWSSMSEEVAEILS